MQGPASILHEQTSPEPQRALPQLSWGAAEFRRVGHRAVDILAHYLEQLPSKPVFTPMDAEDVAAITSARCPVSGNSPDDILEDFAQFIAPFPFGNGHPRFYGWVNSPPLPIGIIADFLASGMNPSVAGGNHAAVYVERAVIDWFKQLLGFPESAMGLLVSGGSMAGVIALAVARNKACEKAGWSVRENGVQDVPRRLVVYKGAEGHACHQKAIELLGLGSSNLRIIPSDTSLRIIPDALEEMILEDIAAGSIPVAVVASAGTVNTGAIDPLAELADVCNRNDVWLHVDGAYGAPAILTNEYRSALSEISRADSVAVDPHKWMYAPVEAGMVLIKDAVAMRDTFSLVPPYLRTDGNVHGVQGLPWFSEFGVQQTRGFKALKVWMAIRALGIEGYRELIDHDLRIAAYMAARIRTMPELELYEPTSLSIVCFRFLYDQSATEIQNTRVNRTLLERLQLGGKAFVSSTVIADRFWLRACVVNPLATTEDVDILLEEVRTISAQLRA
jgi:glutamate/tyrosine decarboxylase-like PLP-dependent enzyme